MNAELGGALAGFAGAGGLNAAVSGIQGIQAQGAANKQGQQIASDMQTNNQQAGLDLNATNLQSDLANPDLQAALHPMADPSHPVWGVLGQAAGVPGGVDGMQNGGVVKLNHGAKTNAPPFMRGPAPAADAESIHAAETLTMARGGVVPEMAAGRNQVMGQGITPASPEGQVLTMAKGGAVPAGPQPANFAGVPALEDGGMMPTSGANFMPVPGQATPQVSGRAAGLSTGLAAGMAMGHNLREAYQQQQARSAASAQEDTQRIADENAYRQSHGMAPLEQSDGSILGNLRSHINNFLTMFHGHSHDEQGNLADHSQAGGAMPASPAAGAAPAQAAAPASGVAAPPTGAAPAPGAAPAGAGAPPAAAPPGAPAPAGGAPPAAQPAASPVAQAAGQIAGQSGGSVQANASATAVGQAQQQLAADARSGQPPVASQGKQRVSLNDEDWHRMEQAKFRAASAAAQAGMDPTRVYQALTAQQTAHFQGQYIYQLGKAQQALQAGDYDSMKQFMRNANYYLPNGQDIEFKTAGALTGKDAKGLENEPSNTPVVANPFYGLPGHDGDAKYLPLNPMSLNSFATAALDPRNFAQGQMDLYKAGLDFKVNMQKANAAYRLATGRYMQGAAAEANAQTNLFMAPYKAAMDQAHADAYEAAAKKSLAGNTGGNPTKISASQVLAYQKAGAGAFDNASQGELEAVPAMVQNASGKMVPNLSPGAGKQVRNPNKVSPMFAGLTPEERQGGRQMAQTIAGANVGSISPEESAQLSAMIIRDQRLAKTNGGQGGTHINPHTNKPARNVVYAPAKGADGQEHPAVWVWNNGRYVHAWTTPNMSEDTGSSQAIPSGGSEGGSSPSDSTENDANDEAAMNPT